MKLRKDDPVYYSVKIKELMEQARNEGLSIKGEHLENGIKLYFKADNGDVAGVNLTEG